MLKICEKYLQPLQSAFSRKKAWKWFIVIVMAFMVREDFLGVTSFIRALALKSSSYAGILHFFASDAWSVDCLVRMWTESIRDFEYIERINGRPLLIGDTTNVNKELGGNPAVRSLYNSSNDNSKRRTVFGNCVGCVALSVGTQFRRMCLPLSLKLHEGKEIMERLEGVEPEPKTLRIVRDAYAVALALGCDCYLALDSFYLGKPLVQLVEGLSAQYGIRMDIVVRCKSNVAAWDFPEPETKKRRGPKRKKGKNQFHPMEFFETRKDLFKTATLEMYGKMQEVSYYACNLLWKQGYYKELRFICVEFNGRRLILATTDLTLDPTGAIEMYARRFSIESLFKTLKHVFGGFAYHFWTKKFKKLCKKLSPEQIAFAIAGDLKLKRRIANTISKIEKYMAVVCVALSLTIILAYEMKEKLDPKEICYMRTYPDDGVLSVGLMMRTMRSELMLAPKKEESFILGFILEKSKIVG